ncbi:MAG: DUF2087 domain-containing protein [Actinomycetales bacterium]
MDAAPVLKVLAALANPACYRRFIEVAAAGSLPPDAAKTDGILSTAGLLIPAAGGQVAANAAIFRALLAGLRPADPAVPTGDGTGRFLRNGRLESYPRKPEDRQRVFGAIAADVFSAVARLSERELNAALSPLTDDVARLRRAMIDDGVLVRTADGSRYTLAVPATQAGPAGL